MEANKNKSSLLSVEDLTVQIKRSDNSFYALKNISFELMTSETLALIGQSASGKTLTALALMGLLPKQVNQISGNFSYKDKKYSFNSPDSFQHLRGKEIATIFQEPKSALNPVLKIGNQLHDVIEANRKVPSKQAKIIAKELLIDVGFSNAESIYNSYVHQLSGGMAQRVLIAMALSCNPSIIIADEITTALDVSSQLQILNLIKNIQKKIKFSLIFISHDMALVSKISDSICVLSKGKIIEKGNTAEILKSPQNSETKALIDGLINNLKFNSQHSSEYN